MLSLVGAYKSSSDSETDEESKSSDPSISRRNNKTQVGSENSEQDLTVAERSTEAEDNRNADEDDLIEDEEFYYGESVTAGPSNSAVEEEDSDSDSEDDDEPPADKVQEQVKRTQISLENPFRTLDGSTEVNKGDSVFQIQFREEEYQKSEALQKHVKMTSTTGTQDKINGKKVCWNFRKGKCRFGHNCKYGHDSDLLIAKKASGVTDLTPTSSTTQQPPINSSFVLEKKPSLHDGNSFINDPSVVISSVKPREKRRKPSSSEDERLEDCKGNKKGKKRKRRPGLSQNLAPGKKVMNSYYKQKTS